MSGPLTLRPGAVLFSCSMNAVRSPVAEGLAKALFGREVYFASAGVREGEPDPFAQAVMAEVGLDITGHRPHTFEDLEDSSFDLIVTLSPEAHHKALERRGGVGPDPGPPGRGGLARAQARRLSRDARPADQADQGPARRQVEAVASIHAVLRRRRA